MHYSRTNDELYKYESASVRDESMDLALGKLYFVTSLWGNDFVKLFINITLPSILSPQNIPAAARHFDICYHIFTSERDILVIQSAAPVQELRKFAKIEYHIITDFGGNKYEIASECYRVATRKAHNSKASIIYVIPDMILADGGIAHIVSRLAHGVRAVLVAGIRVQKETIVPELIIRYKTGNSLTVKPRELVALALRNVHPLMHNHMWDHKSPGFHPSFFCWPVDETGFYLHCAHLQPFAINLDFDASGISFYGTIDDDLLAIFDSPSDKIEVISDSDNVVWFELSAKKHTFGLPCNRTLGEVLNWLHNSTSGIQRKLMRYGIRIHSGQSPTSAWSDVYARAQFVVNTILDAYLLSETTQYTDSNHSAAATRNNKKLIDFGANSEMLRSISEALRSLPIKDVIKLQFQDLQYRCQRISLNHNMQYSLTKRFIARVIILFNRFFKC